MDVVQFVDSIGEILPLAADTFTRTVAGGLGTADTGQVWTVRQGAAAQFSVNGSAAVVSLNAVNTPFLATVGQSWGDYEIRASFTCPVVATGAEIEAELVGAWQDNSNMYLYRLLFMPSGLIELRFSAVVGGGFTTAGAVTGLAYVAGQQVNVVARRAGAAHMVKAWPASGAEPGWQVSATNSAHPSGPPGWRSVLVVGNTNATPVAVQMDNFTVASLSSVRLDLNDDVTWSLDYKGTDFSPPPLKEAYANTLLTDGELQTASAYENRRIKLSLDLIAATPDAVAARLSELWRELNRDGNFLRWQPQGMSKPVFFRTIRSSQTSVVDYPGAGTLRTVDVVLTARPTGYGLRESLPQVTVNNDPAAGSNGCFFDVTGVKGDVETPLYLSVPGTGLVTSAPDSSRTSAIAVRRRGAPSAAPFVLQAEAMSTAADTTVQANSTAMSGGGSNWTRTTFATTAAMQDRLTIATWPATPSVDVRGTYRVFMRYRSSSIAPGTMQARLLWATSNSYSTNDTVDLIKAYGGAGGPYILYADLGLVQFPQGYDPVSDGPDGVELPVEGMSFVVQAARTSGAASLDIDLLLFVPAGDRLLLATWPASPTLPVTLTLDSDKGQIYTEGTVGVLGRSGAQLAGSPPMVSPGVTNRVYFVRDVGTSSSTGSGALGDEITATTTVSPYYWPRYLYTRPSSS